MFVANNAMKMRRSSHNYTFDHKSTHSHDDFHIDQINFTLRCDFMMFNLLKM